MKTIIQTVIILCGFYAVLGHADLSDPDILIFTQEPTTIPTQIAQGSTTPDFLYEIKNELETSDLPLEISIVPDLGYVQRTGGNCGSTLGPKEKCTLIFSITLPNDAPLGSSTQQLSISYDSRLGPLTSEIAFEIITGGLEKAYTANFGPGENSITICPVVNALIDLPNCHQVRDILGGTFNRPIDVVVNNTATPNMVAYVANAGNNNVSMCPLDSMGNISGACTNILNQGDLALAGLNLSEDNSHLYVSHYTQQSISSCSLKPDGSINVCNVPANAHHAAGRFAVNSANTHGYVANVQFVIGQVNVCSAPSVTCVAFGDTNAKLHNPISADVDATGKWLYLPNYPTNELGVCPINPDGSLSPCSANTAEGTLAFLGAPVNLFMRSSSGYGYIPNTGNNTISICRIDATTGNFFSGSCHAYGSATQFASPTSVWIAKL